MTPESPIAADERKPSEVSRGSAAPPPSGRRYILIMTVRDEADYIEQTLDCIARQTLRPWKCIVVDDGSKDRTGEIADEAAARHGWIQVVHRSDRGSRHVGGGVVETFYAGHETIGDEDYDFICKIDGDVTFEDRYFEHLVHKFEEDPRLGGASGKTFNPVDGGLKEERMIDEMVAGQVNFWRRSCWEEAGGYVRMVMWDGIIFHRVRMNGWTTVSFRDEDLVILHHRLMGSSHRNILHGRMRWGRGQWFMGTHPLYIIASGIFRMRERPYIIGGLCIVFGYFRAMLTRVPRYDDPAFRRYLRTWQMNRIGLGPLVPADERASQ